MRAELPTVTEAHAKAERLARAAATTGDHVSSGKLIRISNAIAELRNGLISALS